MEQTGNILSQIPIKNPERWTLALRLSAREMEYLLLAPDDDNALISGKIPLNSDNGGYRKAVEDAIYDNAALLGDFKRVEVVVDNDIYIMAPQGVDSDKVFTYAFPQHDGDCIAAPLRGEASLIYGIDSGIVAFFERTYPSCRFHHSLALLHDFFHRKATLANSAKLYAILTGDRITTCCFKGGNTVLAATNTFRHINDAAYYIFATWSDAAMDPQADEVQIAGNNKERNTLIELLKNQIRFVMAVAFPPTIAKQNAHISEISFDLTLATICE